MTDDQTDNSLRFMPKTQRLLVERGTRFTNSFVAYPLCCPSRATFLTGQYAHNHGVLYNTLPTGGVARFDDSNALPVWLQAAGYHTALIGKYLNGWGNGGPTFTPPGWSTWYGAVTPYAFNGPTLSENGAHVKYAATEANYQTDLYARKAAEVIRANAAGPLFLYVAFGAPHERTDGSPPAPAARHVGAFADEPLPRPPSFNEADVSDKPSFQRRSAIDAGAVSSTESRYRRRLESLLAVDDAVETIVRALVEVGRLDDTLIVLTSDNGFFHGEHRIPKGKYWPYEESVQVPLVLRGPGVPGGQMSRALVSNVDLAPTIVELAGASAQRTMDGLSLLPIARDPMVAAGRDLLIESGQNAREAPYAGVRSATQVYTEYATGDRELYDLAEDPYQLESQHAAASFAVVRSELARRLSHLRSCFGIHCGKAPHWSGARGGAAGNPSRPDYPGQVPSAAWRAEVEAPSTEAGGEGTCLAAAQGRVFAVAGSGSERQLVAVDTLTGAILWSSAAFQTDRRVACPATDGVRVYIARGSEVAAFGAVDGAPMWSAELGAAAGTPTVEGGRVFVSAGWAVPDASRGGSLIALDAATGRRRWSADAPATPWPPVVAAERVVLRANDVLGASVSAFGAADGARLWTAQPLGGVIDAVVANAARVLVASSHGALGPLTSTSVTSGVLRSSSVTSLSAQDGTQTWNHPSLPSQRAMRLATAGGRVYVLNLGPDGVNSVDALDESTGAPAWATTATGTAPQLFHLGGTLFAARDVIRASDGTKLGAHGLPWEGRPASDPAYMGGTFFSWSASDSQAPGQLAAYRDTTAPGVSQVEPPEDQVVSPRPTLSWQADDGAGSGIDHVTGLLGDMVIAPALGAGTYVPPRPLVDGYHRWQIAAADRAGNRTSSTTRRFIVDSGPPETTISSGPAQFSATRDAKFVFATNERDSRLECRLDGSAWTGCESPQSYSGLADGAHKFEARAIDAASNVDASPAFRNWTVDTVPPTIASFTPPNGGGMRPTDPVLVKFSEHMALATAQKALTLVRASDGASVAGRFTWAATTMYFRPSSALENGASYTARVTTVAKDRAGNHLASPGTTTFTVR
jgi:N-acetylglucosamine-6-sulfatase